MSALPQSPSQRAHPAPPLAAAPQSVPLRSWDPISFRMERIRTPEDRLAEAAGYATRECALPSPAHWGATIARSAIECLLGLRPHHQLLRWLDEPVYQALRRRVWLAEHLPQEDKTRPPRTAYVRSAHAVRLNADTAEVSVVLHDGRRCRAAALRLERYHGRWLVTALEIG